MTLNDLERQNRGFYGFFGDFGLRHNLYHSQGGATELSLCDPDSEFGICCINLAWTSQFSVKLLNRNCYRLSHVSWALAQISCFFFRRLWDRLSTFYGISNEHIINSSSSITVRQSFQTAASESAVVLSAAADRCIAATLARPSSHWSFQQVCPAQRFQD